MTEMVKIVLSCCYGGFGLSDKAIKRYAEIKGWTCEKDENDEYGFLTLINEQGERISSYDLGNDRTDLVLVQVVEELGKDSNSDYSDLYIMTIKKGTKYFIDEYDGLESLLTPDTIDWSVA